MCQTPFASIVLTGCGEAWCTTGEPLPAADVPVRDSFSEYTRLAPRLFEIPDATLDERFCNADCVIGTLTVRSYAGCALRTARGDLLGTLSVYGTIACRAIPLLSAPRSYCWLSKALLKPSFAHASPSWRCSLWHSPRFRRPLPSRLSPPTAVPASSARVIDRPDLVTARDNLRDVETMFRNTFDQAPIGIAHANRRGRILRCNQAFCTMLRFDPDDLANKTMAEVTHSDDVKRVSAEIKRLWMGDVPFVDLEKRYLRKDGSFLWVRMTTALVREGDAKPRVLSRVPSRHQRTQGISGRARTGAQTAPDCLATGRHGRSRHQCAAQRWQHPEQRQYLGKSRGRTRQAVQSPRRVSRGHSAAWRRGSRRGNFLLPTSVASAYQNTLPLWANS